MGMEESDEFSEEEDTEPDAVFQKRDEQNEKKIGGRDADTSNIFYDEIGNGADVNF